MKYLSLFSGIGGFELGIQQAYENLQCTEGIQQRRMDGNGCMSNTGESLLGTEPLCIGYSEIDKYAAQIYQSHFPEHKAYGDITKINTDELPDFDLLVGGFPCQAFSIAGKRRGFEDTRGTMFFELARILRAKQPRLFVFENVKGLLSHDNGNTFKTIISAIDELGYDCQWQVLNSKNHGVPQNRERVFIVGHLRGTRRPQVFPIRGSSDQNIGKGQPVFATIRATYPGNWNGDYIDTDPIDRQEKETLYDESHFRQEGKLRKSVGFSPTLNTAGGGRTHSTKKSRK